MKIQPGWRAVLGTLMLLPLSFDTPLSAVSAPTVQVAERFSDHNASRLRQATWRSAQVPASVRPTPITIRPPMLADHIEELAGQTVRILNARVVGVFEPNAFLIEPASRYEEFIGQRDRILVLVGGAALRVPAETIVASTIRVLGVARTLLSARVSGDVPWPAKLDAALVERLEVRAAILATSVQTAEGTELTNRGSAAPQ